jgi:hypothetical protein
MFHGPRELARARAPELHGAGRGAGLVKFVLVAASPHLHRHTLRLRHQDWARGHAAQGHGRQHDRRLSADRRRDAAARLSKPRQQRRARAPVLALLGLARADAGVAALSRGCTRIAAYGLTEQRYLIVLIGVWARILAVLRIWRARSFDLRLVPGVLAILLLAASFGP